MKAEPSNQIRNDKPAPERGAAPDSEARLGLSTAASLATLVSSRRDLDEAKEEVSSRGSSLALAAVTKGYDIFKLLTGCPLLSLITHFSPCSVPRVPARLLGRY